MAISTISRIEKEKTERNEVFNRITQAIGEETSIWHETHQLLDIIEVRMWNDQLSLEENRERFTVFYAWWEHFAKDRYPDYLILLKEPDTEDATAPWDFEV